MTTREDVIDTIRTLQTKGVKVTPSVLGFNLKRRSEPGENLDQRSARIADNVNALLDEGIIKRGAEGNLYIPSEEA